MEGEVKGKTFKMNGHTLPGINQRSEGNTDLADGRSKSSTFQQAVPGAAVPGSFVGSQRTPPILPPVGGVGATGGVGTMPGVFPSKPSIAKIYNRGELTKEVLNNK